MEVAHNLVENAIDVLIKRVDPGIGEKILLAAMLRNAYFPEWLTSVYGAFVGPAAYLIPIVEDAFRGMMQLYGTMFYLPEADIIYMLSQQMASYAPYFLPADAQIPPATAFAIAKYGTEKAMEICEGTFLKEIEATVKYVNANMPNLGY
jgi:hypothetical protein